MDIRHGASHSQDPRAGAVTGGFNRNSGFERKSSDADPGLVA
jgi:hypothetical protein